MEPILLQAIVSKSDKRNTIFPGSDEQVALSFFGKEPNSASDNTTPVPPPKRAYTKDGRKRIQLPINPSTSTTELIPVRKRSPWDLYRKGYRLELGGSVAVVSKMPATDVSFTIRSFSGADAEEKLYMLRLLRHENVLHSYEIFSFEEDYYVVSELMSISLEAFIIARPDELELAIIIYQILNGISFFASQNLSHGAITCSNVLVSDKGVVKIANPECCYKNTQQSSSDVLALGLVMKQLMENGTNDGRFALQRPDRWSEETLDFLSTTMSASPKQLAKRIYREGKSWCC
ncbi:MAG: hypothetical protein M1840_000644 [Geoglossum simile]|nr:MAG: hypothetical protein M1840_000644 [Geoglossum simile]